MVTTKPGGTGSPARAARARLSAFPPTSERFERLEDLKKQLLKDPENTALRFEAGTVCLELHREEEAARWFQSVLRLDPRHVPTHKTLADYFQKHGDSQRAEYHRRRAEGGGETGVAPP